MDEKLNVLGDHRRRHQCRSVLEFLINENGAAYNAVKYSLSACTWWLAGYQNPIDPPALTSTRAPSPRWPEALWINSPPWLNLLADEIDATLIRTLFRGGATDEWLAHYRYHGAEPHLPRMVWCVHLLLSPACRADASNRLLASRDIIVYRKRELIYRRQLARVARVLSRFGR